MAVNTKMQTAIKSCMTQINEFAEHYRSAYHALSILGPILKSWKHHFKVLNKVDVWAVPTGYKPGEGSATLSWIWLEPGVDPNDPDSIMDGK